MNDKTTASRVRYGTYSSQREESTRATRLVILRTARRLFSQQGYGNTGIGAIAEAAGVSRPTFYQHFPTKKAVLADLISEFEAGIVALYEDLAAISTPSRSALAEWCTRFLRYCESDRETVLLVLSTIPTEAEVAQEWADLYQRLLTIAAKGHPAFAVAAADRDGVIRGRAISLLAQIEALPRLAMAAVPQCAPQDLIEALAENMVRFIEVGGVRT